MPVAKSLSNSDEELVANAEKELLEAAEEIDYLFDRIDMNKSLIFALGVTLFLLMVAVLLFAFLLEAPSSAFYFLFVFILLDFAALIGVSHRNAGLLYRAKREVELLKSCQAELTGFVGFDNDGGGSDSKEDKLSSKTKNLRLRRIDEVMRRGN